MLPAKGLKQQTLHIQFIRSLYITQSIMLGKILKKDKYLDRLDSQIAMRLNMLLKWDVLTGVASLSARGPCSV